MITYLTRRLLWIIPVLFAVSVITFVLMHAVPGGPWAREKALPDAVEARLNARIRTGQAALSSSTWSGQAGSSLATSDRRTATRTEPSTTSSPTASWITVQLGIMAFFLSIIVGIPLGILAALGHNRWPDYLHDRRPIIGIATPSFIIAIMLIIVFSVQLGWFPTGGWKGPEYWVLPTIALAGFPIAVIARYTRASMLEVTRKDYIRTAHSKGLRNNSVVTRHMIRNALIPVVTILGPTLAFLVTGSFIIERVFNIPGMGQFYLNAISTRDYSLLMAMTMLYAFAVAFLNVVVDILYAYIDPRIRYS